MQLEIEIADNAESMLEEIADLRLAIAKVRAGRSRELYPEIELAPVVALDNGAIIVLALRRELQHQRQVHKDMTPER